MIKINQKILAGPKGGKKIVAKGTYNSLPSIFKDDPDFMHYVESGYIEGYKATPKEKKDYKPLKTTEKQKSYEEITPENAEEKDNADTKKKSQSSKAKKEQDEEMSAEDKAKLTQGKNTI